MSLPQPQTADATALATSNEATMFYVVSKRKFVILYLATFGFYFLYWFWKNWDNYRDKLAFDPVRSDIMPPIRTFFAIFFIPSLFSEIKAYGGGKAPVAAWRYGWTAAAVIAVFIIQQVLPAMVPETGEVSLFEYLLYGTLGVEALLLVHVQAMINVACDDPSGAGNSRFTGANYAWITAGALFWIPVLIGLLLGPGD